MPAPTMPPIPTETAATSPIWSDVCALLTAGAGDEGSAFAIAPAPVSVTHRRVVRFAGILSSPKTDLAAKIFLFTRILIYGIHSLSPCRHEGRFAVVTKRGAGC